MSRHENFMDTIQRVIANPHISTVTFLELYQKMSEHPEKMQHSHEKLLEKILEFQDKFMQDCNKYQTTKNFKTATDAISENPVFNFINQYHKTMSDWMLESVNSYDHIDKKLKLKANFFIKQYIDMLSPNNFPMFNSEFIKTTIDTAGENIKNGLELLTQDMQNGTIATTDKKYYSIGKNIACTKGKVVYKNDIIELIQYLPTTESVFAIPMLIIPPWINKFYILDLTEKNSFVKWCVDNAITVFMVSWVNPDQSHKDKGFDDYISEGIIPALEQVRNITKSTELNTLGYCLGGTILASFLAYIKHPKCEYKPTINIKSATFLTTMLDFANAGELSIFITEQYLKSIDSQINKKGYLDGNILFNTFSMLKANDMVWRYVINSYMLGKKPPAHSILFWNADPMNITKSMQMFLSRVLYKDNILKNGKVKVNNIPINLKLIKKLPIYMVSMQKDHLVPWIATFDSVKVLNKNNIRFCLGGSGHVAGVVNHPSSNKYCYWVNENAAAKYESPEEWLADATKTQGSWWIDWMKWVKGVSGKEVKPQRIDEQLPSAPGQYVKVNITE